MKRRAGAAVRSGAWIAFLAGSIAALHRLGDSRLLASADPTSWDPWTPTPDPASMIIGAVRLLALGTGWYLLVASLALVTVRLLGWWRAVAALESVVPRLVRRAVHGTIGLTLVAGPTPALAAPPSVAPAPAAAAVGTTAPIEPTEPPEGAGAITMRRLPDDPSDPAPPDPPAAAAPTAGRTWTIAPGDHLWSIARHVLEGHLGRPPSDREVDPYWRTLIEVNRSRLAQPEVPDLVHPGQVMEVPPPPSANV